MDPYSLENLLPAGIVLLHFESESAFSNQSLTVDDDSWKSLGAFIDTHRLLLSSSSQPRLQELESLIQHRCVRATWRPYQMYLRIRVYLIPFDLSGVCGHLAARHRGPAQLLRSRKELISLLMNTNRSYSAWIEQATPAAAAFEPFIAWEADERTLAEIYSDLPSPVIDAATFLSGADSKVRDSLKDALHWIAPPGMRPLYGYQRRTVARMLQQESDPGNAPDPLYIPIRGVGDTQTFWLQPSNMEILRERPVTSQAKGGILCEEMGTGKTCMVIGLIMATKDQLSSPEDAPYLWDAPERPVLTPLALRHFPTPQFKRARADARMKTQSSTFPSLVETLTHFIRASPEYIGKPGTCLWEKVPCHIMEQLQRNHPFYHAYEHVPATTSPRRKGIERGPRRVYLTSATLVVVPRSILEQWNSEINKHCEDGKIRTLSLDTGSQMPPAQQLASEYDIILLTHERFSAEKTRCKLLPLYSWKLCNCEDPKQHAARVPCCTCTAPESVSPLVQIRWKRLVVDEGHVSATQNNLATLAQELSVERRWIVSGTPTRNLMGLSLGNHVGETAETEDSLDGDEDGLSSTLEEDPATYPGDLVYPSEATDEEDNLGHEGTNKPPDPIDGRKNNWVGVPQHSRQWTHMDREDLKRLRMMIAKFIGVPRFAYDSDIFRKKVIDPLLDPNGPCFGAIQVVSQVMGQVMFRHQIQDVERELPEKLPPLKEKTVALKFQPLAAKTYNVVQSGIAVNAVDSQRRDQDYFFHPTQRAPLRQALENLTQTMFWQTDEETQFDIDGAVRRSEEALETAHKRNVPEFDIKLVEESLRVQRDAACDPLWRSVMKRGDVTFVVRSLPPAVQHAWLKLGDSLCEGKEPLLDPDRLNKLRDILVNSPLISEQRLIDYGFEVARQDDKNEAKYQEYLKSLKGKRKRDDDLLAHHKVIRQTIAKAGSKEQLQELNREISATIDRKERGQIATASSRTNELFASRPSLISPKIGNSGSSKINYILRKVLKHAEKEKFLIFSAFPLSLAYVAEALGVAHVPYLQYITRIESRVRQQTVMTFETSDKYRVLLIDLKLGARGLNLVTASRIIFCEPVWQGDVESQAIKRAHRIGQKAARIKVSTLAMQGTSEEAMVTRRRALQNKSERLPAMMEDIGMKEFLQNPTFIGPEYIEDPGASELYIPLVPRHYPSHVGPESGDQGMDVDVDVPQASAVASRTYAGEPDGSPVKKRKLNRPIVRFT